MSVTMFGRDPSSIYDLLLTILIAEHYINLRSLYKVMMRMLLYMSSTGIKGYVDLLDRHRTSK